MSSDDSPRTVFLLTDFGAGSPYVGAMKAVMLGIAPSLRIVDLCHDVPPQDVTAGALILGSLRRHIPPRSVVAAVVDPGVGSRRQLLAAAAGGIVWIAPDNGLLSCILPRRIPGGCLRRIAHKSLWLPRVSRTFHGRDIIAPVAARLASGMPIESVGPGAARHVRLRFPAPRRDRTGISGRVVYADRFGNLVTNITEKMVSTLAAGGPITVRIAGRTISGLSATYSDAKPGRLLALVGSFERLEIAVRNGSAAAELGAGPGDPVRVER